MFFSSWWEPVAQPCALDRSSYSRRAQKKSTAEANYFYFFPLQSLYPEQFKAVSLISFRFAYFALVNWKWFNVTVVDLYICIQPDWPNQTEMKEKKL
jgi:hypothetical protein